jgi:hypothetical protein
MPSNLQRLSACMSSILAVLECPVCLDTIPPPAHQCGNGHLICVKCRVQTERCPVCRVRFCRARSLLADQVFHSLTEAFELEDERPARLRQRLFGAKGRTAPEPPQLKISLASTPTNKFLTRILGKASSAENLSSSPVSLSAVPRNLSEFSSSLRAKSLSTSEICRPAGSRPLSPTPSVNSAHLRSSYHGSCESLEAGFAEDEQLYSCPCEEDCPALMKGLEVLQHIQEAHEGPLVHYFKPRLALSLPLAFEESAVLAVTTDGKTFFLKVVREGCSPGDTSVWLWMLGSKQQADNYELILNLKGQGSEGEGLSFCSRALSLSSTSWTQTREARARILLAASALGEHFAAEVELGMPIKMEAVVKGTSAERRLP